MPKCTRAELSVKLHAYELGMLSTEDREEFEEHLLECSHCFDIIERDAAAFNILKRDDALKQELIKGYQEDKKVTVQSTQSDSSTGKIRSFVMAALSVAAVFFFIYLLDQQPDTANTNSQTIRFNRLRSVNNAVVELKQGGQAIFELPVGSAVAVDSVIVTLNKTDGTEIRTERLAVNKNDDYLKLTIPLESLESGLYLIKMKAIGESNDDTPASFTFRAR